MQKPGVRFRALREAQNLSQEQVAKLLGCSQVYVSQVERGAKFPGRALGADIEQLTERWGSPIRSREWGERSRKAKLSESAGVLQ